LLSGLGDVAVISKSVFAFRAFKKLMGCGYRKRQLIGLRARYSIGSTDRSTPPDRRIFLKRQVSWLAACGARVAAFPNQCPVAFRRGLTAYSCGGSHGLAHKCGRNRVPS
jgi:hypothetical protein